MRLFKKKNSEQKSTSMSANILFNTIYNVLVLLIPLITIPYVSRTLSSGGVGSFSYASSIVGYFAAFANFGMTEYGAFLLAKHRDNKEETSRVFYELFTFRIIVMLLTLGVYFVLVGFDGFNNPDYILNNKRVFFALSFYILGACLEINFLYMGLENFKTISIRSIIVRLLNFLAIIIFVKSPGDYLTYVLIMALSSTAMGASMFIFLHKYINRPKLHLFNPFKYFMGALPFLIPYIAISFLPLISKTVLGSVLGNATVSGDYEVADKILNVVYSIVSASSAVALSRLSFLYAQGNTEEINKKVKETFQFFSIIALPCYFGLMGINRFFVPGFFGEEYRGAIDLLYILGPKILLSPFYAILGSVYFIPSGKSWMRSIFLLLGMVANLVLSIVFTVYLSQTGAAIASVLTELILVILFAVFARGKVNYRGALNTFVKALDAALIMFVVIWVVGKYASARFGDTKMFILLTVLGGIVYVSLLVLFKEEVASGFVKKIKNKLFPKK